MAKRILVVDDDMMCLKTVQKYLLEEGFEVLGALSGMQALHIAAETKFDLLLLDIEMPGLSGFATLEQIRTLPGGRLLPVIFFTGRKDRDTVKRCAAIGAEGYITKPVEKAILIERVEEVFSRLSTYQEEKTVLILDEDIEFLKQMKLHMKKYYKVIVISSGTSAMDYLDTHVVDILVAGNTIMLQNGERILEMLHKGSNGKTVPIIFLGETDTAEAKEGCGTIPVTVYLKKPVNAEVLLQTIQHQLSVENAD